MPIAPPRDAKGMIEPHDHAEINDDSYVIRHIVPHDIHEGRVASGAYSESKGGGMSVDIEAWIVAAGLAVLHYVRSDCGARRLRVGDLRALGMKVGWDPDNGHEHHGAVWNMPKAQSSRRKISRMAILLKKADGEN
jgi:hypothetical protein